MTWGQHQEVRCRWASYSRAGDVGPTLGGARTFPVGNLPDRPALPPAPPQSKRAPPHHIHTGYCSLLSALHPSTSPCPQSPPTAPMASCIFTLPSASLLPAPLLKVLLGDLSDPMKGQASPSSFPGLLLVTALHCPTRHTLFARCLPQRRQTPCHPRAPSNQSIWQGPSQ